MRQLIVTADDFGLALPVNEAIERGHVQGVLSTASLMVAAPATADAVARARRVPSLRVGLHVVLVNGRPALPPERVPLLVNAQGEFERDLLLAGIRYFFTPGIRAQLEAEIRAQFAAFAATGLPLDHANAQNHLHVHPTVLSLLLKVGPEFGLRAVRIPREPFWSSWRAMRTAPGSRLARSILLAPWLGLMKLRLRANGLTTNDYVLGMNDTGHVTAAAMRAFVRCLPRGTTEVYLHPAMQRWPGAEPPDYDFAGEFAALIDPEVARAVCEPSLRRVTYSELAAQRGV